MNAMHSQRGITLVEALISVLVMAILAAVAVPAFTGLFERNRLKSAADLFHTDLHWARSEAVKGNRNVYLSVSSGAAWAYGIGTGSACACTGSACTSCDLKVVSSVDYGGVSIAASTLGASVAFEPRQGQASTGGTASFQNAQGAGLNVVLSALGQPRLCSPSATVPGYPSC